MLHIERATTPPTAPLMKPSDSLCSEVLETFFVVPITVRADATRITNVAASGSYGFWSGGVDGIRAVVSMSAYCTTCPQIGIAPTTLWVDASKTAVNLAEFWRQLIGCTFTNLAIYPATGQAETQSVEVRNAEALESRRLDAAFAALMTYVPEAETVEEEHERPAVRYQFPKR